MPDSLILKKEEQITCERIYKKFVLAKKENPDWIIVSWQDFYKLLDTKERELIKKILSINPKKNKQNIPFLGQSQTPKNLVVIKNQKYCINRKVLTHPTQFLPRSAYSAFSKMNKAIQKDLDHPLIVLAGYRSPAFQSAVFLCNLYLNRWNIAKALKRVALPSYSQHCYPPRQAIDLGSYKVLPKIEQFSRTPEYHWLKKNASQFGFHLSYPKNNRLGMGFEPWHWHFRKK